MKIGIISDIHEDVINLGKAISVCEKQNCDQIVCLGDIVGFSYPNFGFFDTRNAGRCIELIKKNCIAAVAGNHDLHAVRRIPVHSAGFKYPPYWFQLDHDERKKIAGNEVWLNEENEFDPLINSDQKSFLQMLPEYFVLEIDGIKIMLSHYLFPDLTGSNRLFYEQFGPVEDHFRFMSENECLIGFSGHQHIEGAKIFTQNSVEDFSFGQISVSSNLQWIVGPCIANGKNDNGFMIFDTKRFEIDVIPLHSPKKIMQVVYV